MRVMRFPRLLRGQGELVADAVAGRRLLRHWGALCMAMAAGAAVYGAVLGLWHGPRLALYVALKLPLLLLTSSLTVVFSWTAARLLGLPLKMGQVAVLTFLALAVGSVLLASLAPVAWLFTVCAPVPSPVARTAHNLLYLLHTALAAARRGFWAPSSTAPRPASSREAGSPGGRLQGPADPGADPAALPAEPVRPLQPGGRAVDAAVVPDRGRRLRGHPGSPAGGSPAHRLAFLGEQPVSSPCK
jgi:hypothetical protein